MTAIADPGTTGTAALVDMWITGEPRPQGSKNAFVTKQGKVGMRESSKGVKGWRDDIYMTLGSAPDAVRAHWPYTGGVTVWAEFVLRRPASAPKKSTPAATKKPDVEKLARAVADAVTSAGVWHDDSQVTLLVTPKRIAEIGETPGCRLVVIPRQFAWDAIAALANTGEVPQ